MEFFEKVFNTYIDNQVAAKVKTQTYFILSVLIEKVQEIVSNNAEKERLIAIISKAKESVKWNYQETLFTPVVSMLSLIKTKAVDLAKSS